MSEISKQELLRLVQKASGKPIDTQIFEQLYTRTMSQYYKCTFSNFEKSFQDAVQILQHKIAKTRERLLEEKDNLGALKQIGVLRNAGASPNPIKLKVHNAQVLNLQMRNNFLIGSFAFAMQIGDYYSNISQMKPSFNLRYLLSLEIQVQNIGDTLVLSLMSDSNVNLQNSKIEVPIFTLQLNQVVTEVFSYKTDNDLLEIELQYEAQVQNGTLVNEQVQEQTQISQSYLEKYKNELYDYELQLQDLKQMNINRAFDTQDVDNEMMGNYNFRNEPSNNTYGIGIPDYYKQPLELQSGIMKTQENQASQFSYDFLPFYIVAMVLALLSGIALNTVFDCGVIMLSIMIYMTLKSLNLTQAVVLALSIVYDGLLIYLNFLDWLQQPVKWLLMAGLISFAILQIYKIFLIIKNCLH